MKNMAAGKPRVKAAAPECAVISEKQFMRDHTFYSAVSSWLFAIAGATNIGLLSVLSAKILTAVEKGQSIFKSKASGIEPVLGNRKYNIVALMMIAFGGACMCISNWLESKKVVTEWQLGAGKFQRKMSAAETLMPQAPEAATEKPPKPRQWAAAVQKQGDAPEDRGASLLSR